MRSSTGIADKAVGMMQVLKMSWDEKDAAERFFNAADLALAAIAKRITGPRGAVQMAADVMAPPVPGVTLAWTGNELGSPVGAASGVTVKADQLAGRWDLVDVNSQPLPYNNNGTVISGGFYEFKADGTYTWVVDNLVQERGSAKTKTSNISGTYTIDGNLVRMKPKGLLASLGNSLTGNAPLEVRGDGTACLSWTGQTFDYRKK